MAIRSVEEIKRVLDEIHQQLKTDKQLSKSIPFTLRVKSTKDRWGSVLQYAGPDPETASLLKVRRDEWTANPELFVSMMEIVPLISDPVVHIVYQCSRFDRVGAWAEMLRRCFCIVLSQLQKQFRLNAEFVAAQLREVEPHSRVEGKDVSQLQDAGSRYEALEASLGKGVTFVLGVAHARQLWELRIPKTGEGREKAIQHLKSKGIVALARENQDLRTAVFDYLLRQVDSLTMATATANQNRMSCL